MFKDWARADIISAIALIVSSGAAVASFLTWWSTSAEQRRKQKDAADARAACWTLTIASKSNHSMRLAELSYVFDDEPELRLIEIGAIRPRNLLLCRCRNDEEDQNARTRIVPDGPLTSRLRWDAKMPRWLIRTSSGFERSRSSSAEFMVQVPEQPLLSRASTTRLRISIKVEESSASRRRHILSVHSQEIAWTAKQAASAT